MVAKPTQYVDLSGRVYALSGLDKKDASSLQSCEHSRTAGRNGGNIAISGYRKWGSFYTPRGFPGVK